MAITDDENQEWGKEKLRALLRTLPGQVYHRLPRALWKGTKPKGFEAWDLDWLTERRDATITFLLTNATEKEILKALQDLDPKSLEQNATRTANKVSCNFELQLKKDKLLGHGAVGDVYEAEDLMSDRKYAVKLFRSEHQPDARQRREVFRTAKINSPHVVQVVAAGYSEAENRFWLAMELLLGRNIDDYMKQRTDGLLPSEVDEIMSQLCDGLAAIHEEGVIHCDLRPSNVFLQDPKLPLIPRKTVKILDFERARNLNGTSSSNQQPPSTANDIWLAPELTLPTSVITTRTDLWALGHLCLFMLAGSSFRSATAAAGRDSSDLLRSIQERGTKLPFGFPDWFKICTDNDPRNRFKDVGRALSEFREKVMRDRMNRAEPSVQATQRRPNRVASLILLGLVFVLALLGTVFVLVAVLQREWLAQTLLAYPANKQSATANKTVTWTITSEPSKMEVLEEQGDGWKIVGRTPHEEKRSAAIGETRLKLTDPDKEHWESAPLVVPRDRDFQQHVTMPKVQ